MMGFVVQKTLGLFSVTLFIYVKAWVTFSDFSTLISQRADRSLQVAKILRITNFSLSVCLWLIGPKGICSERCQTGHKIIAFLVPHPVGPSSVVFSMLVLVISLTWTLVQSDILSSSSSSFSLSSVWHSILRRRSRILAMILLSPPLLPPIPPSEMSRKGPHLWLTLLNKGSTAYHKKFPQVTSWESWINCFLTQPFAPLLPTTGAGLCLREYFRLRMASRISVLRTIILCRSLRSSMRDMDLLLMYLNRLSRLVNHNCRNFQIHWNDVLTQYGGNQISSGLIVWAMQ